MDTASPQPAHKRRGLSWLARKANRAGTEEGGDQGDVVDLTVRRAGTHPPANGTGNAHDLQTKLGCAFADAPGDATNETVAEDEDDVAFQVTLPRSVIRQIRLRAAQEETTHRAIVLRALRASGLSIPEGADVDRRAVAARRRQQA